MTWDVESPVKEQKELAIFTKASKKHLDELQMLSIERSNLFNHLRSETEEKLRFRLKLDIINRSQDSIDNLVRLREIEILQNTPVTSIWLDKLHGLAMTAKYGNNARIRQPAIQLYKRLSGNQKQTEKGYEPEGKVLTSWVGYDKGKLEEKIKKFKQ